MKGFVLCRFVFAADVLLFTFALFPHFPRLSFCIVHAIVHLLSLDCLPMHFLRKLSRIPAELSLCPRILLLPPCPGIRDLHTSSSLNFWTTPALCAEPLKKKRRIDPSILKAREDRKKRRLEKSIRQLQKNAQKLKPIDEMVVSKKLLAEIPQRTRKLDPVPDEEMERRAVLYKTYTRYKNYQHLAETDKISTMIMSAESALRELRLESEELYQKAVSLESQILPLTFKGPVSTPPIADYIPPDGDYVDVTKKW